MTVWSLHGICYFLLSFLGTCPFYLLDPLSPQLVDAVGARNYARCPSSQWIINALWTRRSYLLGCLWRVWNYLQIWYKILESDKEDRKVSLEWIIWIEALIRKMKPQQIVDSKDSELWRAYRNNGQIKPPGIVSDRTPLGQVGTFPRPLLLSPTPHRSLSQLLVYNSISSYFVRSLGLWKNHK